MSAKATIFSVASLVGVALTGCNLQQQKDWFCWEDRGVNQVVSDDLRSSRGKLDASVPVYCAPVKSQGAFYSGGSRWQCYARRPKLRWHII